MVAPGLVEDVQYSYNEELTPNWEKSPAGNLDLSEADWIKNEPEGASVQIY